MHKIDIILKMSDISNLFNSLNHCCLCVFLSDEAQLALPLLKSGFDKIPLSAQTLPPGFPAPFLFTEGLSSVETLLTNIQVQLLSIYVMVHTCVVAVVL